MKTLYIFPLVLSLLGGVVACSDSGSSIFATSPTERMQEAEQALRSELVSAKYGWRVTYFSRIDSLLYTDMSASAPRSTDELRGRLGYGGHSYLMRFAEDGVVQMRSDATDETATSIQRSSYSIGLGSSTQLSFVTHAYLHGLVNERFAGSSDFLYLGRDWRGGLRFSSPSKGEPATDYMLMEPLADQEEWEHGLDRALAHRLYFEAMSNPQLRIHRGDRDYFLSDLPSRVRVETNMAYLRELEQKRYAFFRMVVRPNPDPTSFPLQLSGVGSGYVGTDEGLSFRPGFRIDDKHFFIDFERRGDRFVAELVSVYDPKTRQTHIESKHLYPEGIPTGYVAEIWDDASAHVLSTSRSPIN